MNNKFNMSRRSFVKTSAAAMAATAIPTLSSFSVAPNNIGISQWSYHLRYRQSVQMEKPNWRALDMAKHCHELGTGGSQILISRWDDAYAKEMRDFKETTGVWVEGQVGMPKSEADLPKFENDVKLAKAAGIDIVRAACLSGRRYVTFETLDDWNDFKKTSMKSIRLAEPIVRKHKLKLALENHKDWTADEMVGIMKHFDSEWLGCTVDTGNNVSFLEDPLEVVEKLAPYAFTTHFKDMAIEDYEDGFLLSEVPFGEGFLDLNKMVLALKKHNPQIKFNLEMMTRDPLKIPYLTDGYWTTFGDRKGKDVAKSIRRIRDNYSETKLRDVSSRSTSQQLDLEESDQLACLAFARNELGIS